MLSRKLISNTTPRFTSTFTYFFKASTLFLDYNKRYNLQQQSKNPTIEICLKIQNPLFRQFWKPCFSNITLMLPRQPHHMTQKKGFQFCFLPYKASCNRLYPTNCCMDFCFANMWKSFLPTSATLLPVCGARSTMYVQWRKQPHRQMKKL